MPLTRDFVGQIGGGCSTPRTSHAQKAHVAGCTETPNRRWSTLSLLLDNQDRPSARPAPRAEGPGAAEIAGNYQWTQVFIAADRAGAIVMVRTFAEGHSFDDLLPLLERQAQSLAEGLDNL